MTSRWLAFLLLILSSAGSSSLAVEPGASWPQFLGPSRNGSYSGGDLSGSWSADGPPVLWRRDVGEGFAGPVVAGGRVFLFHRVADEEVVEALDSATGRSLWSSPAATSYRDDFGFDEGPRATPTVADGRVFTFGAQGQLRALDVETGEELWRIDTHRRFGAKKGFFGAASSPVVDRGRVMVQVGGREGGIVAFDAVTGEVVWTATDDEAGYASPIVAELGSRRLALFFNRAGLVAIEPESGELRFEYPWRARVSASVNAASPLVVGDRIFLSSSYGVGAVLLELGDDGHPEAVWKSQDALTNHYSTSVQRAGILYGLHGRQEARPELRAVEAASGKVLWKETRFGAGSVILADDQLLILREDGRLILAEASPESYREIARAEILAPTVRAYPALAGGILYARDENELIAVDLRRADG